MRILIVCSRNSGQIAPFIREQGDALLLLGLEVTYCTIQGKGLWGYLGNLKRLKQSIQEFSPDLIHAHYGLSGLLANLQRKIPVITTYHGSDINDSSIYWYSRLCMKLSAHNIFVSEKTRQKSGIVPNQTLIPCGVDLEIFKPMEKVQARNTLGFDRNRKIILFAGSYNNTVKNPRLAKEAVKLLENTEMIELKGYIREQVAVLLNAADALLMTSYNEGSPQVIKEALACNCPVVSVPVGDVPEVINDIDGCYISINNPAAIAVKLQQVFDFGKRTEGRNRITELKLDSETVAKRVFEVYKAVMNDKK